MAFFPDIVSLGSMIWHADGSPVDTLEALTIASDLDHRARRSSQFHTQFEATFPLVDRVFLGSSIAFPLSTKFDSWWTISADAPTGGSEWEVLIDDVPIGIDAALSWAPWTPYARRSGLITARLVSGTGTLTLRVAVRGCAT